MLALDVRTDTFEAASAVFGRRLAPALASVYAELTDALRGCASMAGSDQAGRAWAAQYDQAASQLAGLISGLADGCTTLAGLLEQTGFNHGRANAHSDPTRSVAGPPDRTRYVVFAGGNVCTAYLPTAAGGSGGAPIGWSLVQHAVGYAWPDGDGGRLRRAAGAWNYAGARLSDLASLVDLGVDSLSTQRSPEVSDAIAVCTGMRTHIRDTAHACNALADSCQTLAGAIDHAHSMLIHEMASLAAWTAATEAAGAVLGVVTFGGGEVAAQGAEASRIATVAARVVEVLRGLSASMSAMLDVIASAMARAAIVASRLESILGARISVAVTTLAERLPVAERERGSIQLGKAAAAEAQALEELQDQVILARGIDATRLQRTATVAGHDGDITSGGTLSRPFNDSRLTIQEILDAGRPVADPQGAPGAFLWKVPGSKNGRSGLWEIVIDIRRNTIVHFNFVRQG